jgi:fructose-bisphosphate aldolase, class II
MPLAKPQDLFERAFREGWALGAFNTSNLEVTQAIVRAHVEARAPGIVQTSEGAIRYAGLTTLRDLIRDVADEASVPIVLHLDHGKSFDVASHCIEAGYTSVMIDGSALPLAENIALTRRVVERARAVGVWVEGEVGAIPGKEGLRGSGVGVADSLLTDPDDAARFVRETGVDALAVSVGTIHGAFRGTERIRFERLEAVHRAVSVPLVLHGGSGLPAEEIRRAVGLGVAKVNIDTELREAFHDALTAHREDEPDHAVDPRAMLTPARDAVQRTVAEKVSLLGAAGKAESSTG